MIKASGDQEAFPAWQEGMTCGIAWIDNEHQILLRRLDELRRLASGKVDYQDLVRRLVALVGKIENHLAAEREIFSGEAKTATARRLVAEDRDFLVICQDVTAMVEEEQSRQLINEELVWFLRHQLTRHIYRFVDFYGKRDEACCFPDLLVWSPIFSVGEKRLDAEHKVLIGHVNNLNRLLRGEARASAVLQELSGFIEHARLHFDHESGMLNELADDDREAHLREHDQMLQQAERLVTGIRSGRERLTRRQLLDFVRDWVVHHILLVDMKIKYQYRRKKPQGG